MRTLTRVAATLALVGATTLATVPAVADETVTDPTSAPTTGQESPVGAAPDSPGTEPVAEPTPPTADAPAPAPVVTTSRPAAEATVADADLDAPQDDEDTDGTDEPAAPGTVTGAELRWGLNNESNNRAFAPGTFNFFSAGRLGDPGAGGQTLTTASQGGSWSNGRSAGWSATDGDVRIEKFTGAGYRTATWAGLSTDRDGTTIPSATSGAFSEHQLVFGEGTGTVDPAAGTLSLAWEGDATVVYYSGMTFFHLSDPELEVADGRGELTAELSGFASSMEDLSQWGPVAPRRVTVATFSRATVDDTGLFQATPDYLGVVTRPGTQVTGCDVCGSFPRSFIDFQDDAGAAAYWYSSGGSADRFKTALPVTAIVDPDMLPPAPPPTDPVDEQPPSNEVLAPPTRQGNARTAAPASPGLLAAAPAPLARPAAAAAVAAPVAVEPVRPVAYQSAGDHGWLLGATPDDAQLVWWLLAAGLLTTAAAAVGGTAVHVRRLRA